MRAYSVAVGRWAAASWRALLPAEGSGVRGPSGGTAMDVPDKHPPIREERIRAKSPPMRRTSRPPCETLAASLDSGRCRQGCGACQRSGTRRRRVPSPPRTAAGVPPSASSRPCGSSTMTRARSRTRTATSFLRKTSNDRRQIGGSARRWRAAAVHDPLALVRIRPQQLIGRRPTRMLGRGVPLQVPGAEDPAAAALVRAAPLRPGLARVVEAEQGDWLDEADLQTGDADQHREQALDFSEGPGEGPAERTGAAPLRTPMLELVFAKR